MVRRRIGAPIIRVSHFNDFTGGLNIKTQRQELAQNESPDCMDVDFGQRGGISLRRGVKNVTTDANMDTTLVANYGGYLVGQYSAGTEVVWGVSNVGRLWTWDGATAVHVATAITSNTTTEFVHADGWNDKLYFANAYNGGTTLVMRYWNGTAFTALTNNVNNTYTAPTGGNAPLARLVANHGGYMWWADTFETATRYRSRLRFSHPLQPEDFAAADYFDIEPDDQSDRITAIIPFKGHLMVFKKRAVYAVYGTTRDDFVVERLSATGGAWSQEGVTCSQEHCYWWTGDGDVMAWDGKKIVSVGNNIASLVIAGTINPGADHRLTWAERRLYVSILMPDGTTRRTYMYDPSVGRGAWTRYSLQISSMYWWRRSTGLNGIMLRIAGKAGISDLNVYSQIQDFDGAVTTSIPGYYTTSWFAVHDTASFKRWKRMRVTMACYNAATLNVDVTSDFDESTVYKAMTIPITASATGGSTWGGTTWGGGTWGGGDPIYAFERLASAGRAHAIRFKFTVTGHLGGWSLDSYSLPYIVKAYR